LIRVHRKFRDKPDTVIIPGMDIPVVKEKTVRQGTKPFPGFLVGLRNRFLGEVPAGHDQWTAGVVEKEMVKRGIGKHDP
jgi:hypothetical protein